MPDLLAATPPVMPGAAAGTGPARVQISFGPRASVYTGLRPLLVLLPT